MIIENKHPYTGITQPLIAPTERLSTSQIDQRSRTILALGLILFGWGSSGVVMFSAGWGASVVYRTIQPYIATRGSYAIFAICFAVPMLLIWRGNHKIANSWPSDWP